MADEYRQLGDDIKQLERRIDGLEDIHPYYLPKEIKALQNRVLSIHSQLELALETRILLEVKKRGSLERENWFSVNGLISSVLNEVPFWKKVELVRTIVGANESKQLVGALNTVNQYRIEFAHPIGDKLRDKYHPGNVEGLRNIKKVVTNLATAYDAMNTIFDPTWKPKEDNNAPV